MIDSGREAAQVLEDDMIDHPLRFLDKDTLAVTIKNVYVEGIQGVMYTDCEVYLPIGLVSDVSCRFLFHFYFYDL